MEQAILLGGSDRLVISVLVRDGLVKCLNRRESQYVHNSPLRPSDVVLVGPEAEAVWAYAKAHPNDLMTEEKLAELAPEARKAPTPPLSHKSIPALESVPAPAPAEASEVAPRPEPESVTQNPPPQKEKLLWWGKRVGAGLVALWVLAMLWLYVKVPNASKR